MHLPDVRGPAQLGDYYLNRSGMVDMPEEWKGGIDTAQFGRYVAQQEQGVFTEYGYLVKSGDEWQKVHEGQSVPEEYRVLSFPAPEILRDAANIPTPIQSEPQPQKVLPIILNGKDSAERMKEITDRLETGIQQLFDSDRYKAYLTTMAKFHNYSFNNTLLIAMQRPDATLVAGFNAWKNKFNRYVKKGEKGIQIIAPAPIKEVEEREKIDKDTGLAVLNENGEPEMERVEYVVPRFRVTTVFDVSQTDGEPIPSLEVNELTASVKDYALLTVAIEQVSPVPIRFDEIEGEAKGYYSDIEKEICIQVGMGESQTIKTMIHEVAHAMLHNSDLMKKNGEEKDRLTKETEAESIAFTVCSALGIETSDYSFPYVASWASGKEMKELKDSMDTIRLTAADFLEKLETAVAERSAERMTAMQYAEKLIADKEQEITIFDDEQRNLIVNFAFKLDDRAATEELVNGLAAALAEDDKEEANRLMYDAQEKIENLPDGMIGLSEMHDYGYRKDDVLPLTKEGAREWHRLGERIYPLFRDGTAGDYRVFQIKEVHHQHWAKSYAQQVEDGFLIHHQNYQSAYKGKPAPSDTPMTARKRLEEKRPNTFIGRSFGVGDVIVWDEEKGRKFFYVDKEELVEFGGFMDADAAGNTVIYMVPNYQIDGKTGTWLPYDSEVVEGVCFFMMRNEQRKDAVSPVVVDSKGVFVTDAPNGFENVRSTLTEYVQRAEKKQQDMTEHEKCLTNGTYERARESGTEQNYDMIDGCVNNVPKKPRRIGGRWSVLDRLHIKQAQRKQKDQTQQQQQERSRKN